MTQLVRIPWAWPIGTRSGTSLAKDPYIRNGILEKYGDKLSISKRPGTVAAFSSPAAGTSQGAFYFNGRYYRIVNDVLYVSGSGNSGTDGAFWIESSQPWVGRESFGAVVFKGRMFVIGGATPTDQSDIWQTADGLNWSVNSGGQPWGVRYGMGAVVLNNQIFVLGGYNTTLAAPFNDVWSSPDGLNWTQINANPPWAARSAHCCVAASGGIYVFGGVDASATDLNDCWFSADGVNWAECTPTAGWSARSYASGLYFDNRIWIIGGLASAVEQNDAWYSYDGANWVMSTAAAFASARFATMATTYRGLMWVLGGATTSAAVTVNTVYNSADGITWTNVTPQTAAFTARAFGQALVFGTPGGFHDPVLYILGGDTNGSTPVSTMSVGQNNVPVSASYALTPTLTGQPYQFSTFVNGTILVFKNQTNFYVIEGGTLIKVNDANYPAFTVPGLVVLNAFVYVMTPQAEIYSCALENPTLWPALQFLTADYEDDAGVVLSKYLNYVVAFGTYTTQFFWDNGANQPVGSALAPQINSNLRVGCVAAATVATCGNGLFWVGQGDQGARSVFQFNGLVPQDVSTPYVDRILMTVAVSSLIGIGIACDGHEYYVLKTGTSSALVYDISYKEWYEWDTFPYGGYISDFATGGDYLLTNTNGILVQVTPTSYTDVISGDFTLSCQTDKVDHGNTAFKYCGSAVLVGDKSTAQPMITGTDDDYTTYTTYGTVNMNLSRPRLTRLGAFRRRSWRVVQTDNYPARLEALEVEYSQGES